MTSRAVAARPDGLLAWGGWRFLPVYTSYIDLLGSASPGSG